MCFLIDSIELYQIRVKEMQKNAVLAFYRALFAENRAKIREIPYILEKRAYFKKCLQRFSRARMVLKTWNLDCKNLGMYRGIFKSFDFWSIIRAGKKMVEIANF